MNPTERSLHWNAAYASKGDEGVSWFEAKPQVSLDLIAAVHDRSKPSASLVDIGGGASRLVDALTEDGWRVTVVDLSETALDTGRRRLGARATDVDWIAADVTRWRPSTTFDIWHDRAAYHFLTDPDDRQAYAQCMRTALRPGAHAVIGTFAPDGPERCSGLPVMRYDATGLATAVGSGFRPISERRHLHVTPWGSTQAFQFVVLRRDDS
ncbi:MAG: class I SAM-dependent methyltransferase [Rhizobiaceae bacterium]|nr:class I SAM-dependent methyltransferase [Rhizobiaceae bacterium]